MELRELKEKDAPLMLEWMHDDSVVHDLKTDFSRKTLADCLKFIDDSNSDTDKNFAIVDENDEYQGTVSLKHICKNNAEFAITIRKTAMGKGISIWAMKTILDYGFDRGIKSIYWCVSPKNIRALRFYDKNGFVRDDSCAALARDYYSPDEIEQYIWFVAKCQ